MSAILVKRTAGPRFYVRTFHRLRLHCDFGHLRFNALKLIYNYWLYLAKNRPESNEEKDRQHQNRQQFVSY
jgi:hypothetical protein